MVITNVFDSLIINMKMPKTEDVIENSLRQR